MKSHPSTLQINFGQKHELLLCWTMICLKELLLSFQQKTSQRHEKRGQFFSS